MSAVVDPIPWVTDYTKEELEAVKKKLVPADLTNGLEFNPPIPFAAQFPAGRFTKDKWNSPQAPTTSGVDAPIGGFNAPGFIIPDRLTFDPSLSSSTTSVPTATPPSGGTTASVQAGLKFDYGFRFHYNPPGLSETYSPKVDTNWQQYIKTIMSNGSVAAPANTGTTMSFSLRLSRVHDMHFLPRDDYMEYYPTGMTEFHREQLLGRGTMHDLEYLFRTVNGTPQKTWHGESSDIGYLFLMNCIFSLGDSIGARKFRGQITNLSFTHRLFAPGMVPMMTDVSFTVVRIPEFYNKPGQTAIDSEEAAIYASGTGAGGAGSAPLPGAGATPGTGPSVPYAGGGAVLSPAPDTTTNGKNYNGGGAHRCSVWYNSTPDANRGVHDLDASVGTQVYSHASGTVSDVKIVPGGGGSYSPGFIRVTNGDSWILYGHLVATDVTAGQTVQPGTPLGKTGIAPDMSSPHLHIEWGNTPTLFYRGDHAQMPWIP